MNEAPKYEVLVERFRQKVASIPEECHEAIMLWKLTREVQKHRIAAENSVRQTVDIGNKVFWAGEDMPDLLRTYMQKAHASQKEGSAKYFFHDLHYREGQLTRLCEKAFKQTTWFHEVVYAAAEGVGMGPMMAGSFLWTIGDAKRFETFGKIVKYAGLHVTPEGKAPKRKKGGKVDWSPDLRTALFKVTEVWNRMPNCTWRAMWDAHKVLYREKFPEKEKYKVNGEEKTRYNDGHIHNMARRKVQREFLRNLYHLWLDY